MNFSLISNQFYIPGTEFVFDLPSYGGFFSNGIFSAIGFLMFLFLAILVVAWLGFAIYGAFSITSSFGDPQKIEKGWKTIKSVWIGISYFLLFFLVITFAAVFMGVGAPWNWAENLRQCNQGGPASGRFYFQGKFEPDPNDPTKVIRKSYIELLDDYLESAGSTRPQYYVVCCEDGDTEYIDIIEFQSAIPSECALNSTHGNSNVSNVCLSSGQLCNINGNPVGSCCAGLTCTGSVNNNPNSFRCE